MELEKYQNLIKTAEDLERRAERAAGAGGQLRAELKEDHGCRTVEEAVRKQARLIKEIRDLRRRYEKAETALTKRWAGKL